MNFDHFLNGIVYDFASNTTSLRISCRTQHGYFSSGEGIEIH